MGTWLLCSASAMATQRNGTTSFQVRGQTIECSATKGGQPIVLSIDWGSGGGLGKGTLLSPPAAGGASTSQSVVAQQYKGLVLVDVAGTTQITGALATVSDPSSPPKTIRLGDYKQPSYPCK